eukprot:9276980-Karenia_brevis.AAC.1
MMFRGRTNEDVQRKEQRRFSEEGVTKMYLENVLGWTLNMYPDGPRTCIGIDCGNYWDGLRK